MLAATPSSRFARAASSWCQLRVWHLMVLIGYVAIAVIEIQGQGSRDPLIVGLTCAGFTVYALIGCLGWLAARRCERRLGSMLMVILYATTMAALYLIAAIVYLVVEHLYFNALR